MPDDENLMMTVDMEDIAARGQKIYEEIKGRYSPQDRGRCLAIEVNSGDVYLADKSSEAVQMAKAAHPGTVFYVVRIGFSAVETLANMSLYASGAYY